MELLYAYVEKYRIFEKQEFRFSDRFIVNYDPETNHLDIKPNEEYFDIYPGNIVGVSAVVGKNAAGKTSLLSLIGNKPDDRQSEGEAYFLLYFFKNFEKENYFVFETNDSEQYSGLIEDLELPNPEDGETIYSIPCKLENGKLQACLGNQYAVEVENTIIWMRQAGKGFLEDIREVGLRRYVPLQTDSLYDIVMLLSYSMKKANKDKQLFGNNEYTLDIDYRFKVTQKPTTSNSKIISEVYKQLAKMERRILQIAIEFQHTGTTTFSNSQNLLTISVLEEFLRWLVSFTERNQMLKEYDWENILMAIGRDYIQLNMEEMEHALYDAIKVFDYPVMQYWGESDVLSQIEQLKIILNACSIDIHPVRYKHYIVFNIKYLVTCDTLLTENCVSKEEHQTYIRYCEELKKKIDDLQNFPPIRNNLIWKVLWLSDGEMENLAMFASLHKQISMQEWYNRDQTMIGEGEENRISYNDKVSYTLLFDEIERCMHPEMCRCLIKDLITFLQGYPDKQFQIIIASHSPFIVGDLRKENLICLTAGGKVMVPEEQPASFGQNIHTLLKNQFFLDNTFSQYAYEMIDLIAQCLACKKEKDEAGIETKQWKTLAEMREDIIWMLGGKEGHPWKKLPENDRDTLLFLQSMIRSIGEPIIRNTLQDELDRWRKRAENRNEEMIEAEIEWHRNRLRELEEERKK